MTQKWPPKSSLTLQLTPSLEVRDRLQNHTGPTRTCGFDNDQSNMKTGVVTIETRVQFLSSWLAVKHHTKS